MWRKRILVALAVLAFLANNCQTSSAVVMTGTPNDSWAYSVLSPAGKPITTTYYPTNRSEFSGAVFQGYATYEQVPVGAEWFYTGSATDTFHIFGTYVLSPADMTIPVRIGGDDGHSLFIDNAFVGGGGFDVPVTYQLGLVAGVARYIEVAGYNAGGPSVFHIGVADSSNPKGFVGTINEVPGVYLNAEGDFSSVPEPTSIVLWCGLGAIGVLASSRRKQAC